MVIKKILPATKRFQNLLPCEAGRLLRQQGLVGGIRPVLVIVHETVLLRVEVDVCDECLEM